MGILADRAFTYESLQAAWEEVLANDQTDGVESYGVRNFAENVEDKLASLSLTLGSGEFTAGQLQPVSLTTGVKTRQLHVPCVRDRIAARAILDAVTPIIDPELGHGAYAYRPGLGVADAVQAVAVLREEGLGHVLRADVRDCFPTLPKHLAIERFEELVDDGAINTVVDMLMKRRYRSESGAMRTLTGIPQGCPLSPMLANLVLRDLDEALAAEGFPIVRYGDDILVATTSEQDVREASRILSTAVGRLGMETNQDKTRFTSFAEGFAFLGEDFGPRYPPLLSVDRCQETNERALYVGLQGAGVKLRDGRILVLSTDDAELLDVPSSQVSRIVTFGSVGLSAGVRNWALGNEVDVVMASRKGNYVGTMLSHGQRYRPARLRAQMALTDTEREVTIARAIVHAKITKQRIILERNNRRPMHESVARASQNLAGLLRLLPDATNTAEAMGVEGAAARFYFEALGQLAPEGMRFSERSRQPPIDVFNAALSYLYTILMGECVTALHAAGLDPAFGILHSDQAKRASLALDLMEEFRPWLVDQVVLEAVRQRRLRPEHAAHQKGGGVLLNKEGKVSIVEAYERRLLGSVRGALADFAGSRRRHIYRQAQRLRASIMDPAQDWTGLSWRP